jgi:hypothetical protein
MSHCLFSRRTVGLTRARSRGLVLLGAAASALTLSLVSSSAADAALISTSACDGSALSQPFAQFNDHSSYKLVPGGNFEGALTGWSLSPNAGVVAGGEPFNATGTASSRSLRLSAGASAQSPWTCVNAAYPTFRFFAHNDNLLSTVLVQVVYRNLLGLQVSVPVGAVALSTSWHPTLPMLTTSALPAAVANGTTQIALRFTALTGSSEIDDVFVDPRCT